MLIDNLVKHLNFIPDQNTILIVPNGYTRDLLRSNLDKYLELKDSHVISYNDWLNKLCIGYEIADSYTRNSTLITLIEEEVGTDDVLAFATSLVNVFEEAQYSGQVDKFLMSYIDHLQLIKIEQLYSFENSFTAFKNLYEEFYSDLNQKIAKSLESTIYYTTASQIVYNIYNNKENEFVGKNQKLLFIFPDRIKHLEIELIKYLCYKGKAQSIIIELEDLCGIKLPHVGEYLNVYSSFSTNITISRISSDLQLFECQGVYHQCSQAVLKAKEDKNFTLVCTEDNQILLIRDLIDKGINIDKLEISYKFANTRQYAFFKSITTLLELFWNESESELIETAYLKEVIQNEVYKNLNGTTTSISNKMLVYKSYLKEIKATQIEIELFTLPINIQDFYNYFEKLASYFQEEKIQIINNYFAKETIGEILMSAVALVRINFNGNKTVNKFTLLKFFSSILDNYAIKINKENSNATGSGISIINYSNLSGIIPENLILINPNDANLNRYIKGIEILSPEAKTDLNLNDVNFYKGINIHKFYNIIYNSKLRIYYTNPQSSVINTNSNISYIQQLKLLFYTQISALAVVPYLDKPIRNDILIRKDENFVTKITEKIEKNLSFSFINSYVNCSYQHFLTYVVGLKTEDIEIETLDNIIAGEIIHNVLEKIYEGVKTLDEEGRYKKLSSLPNIVIDNYIIDQFKKKFNDDEYFLNISSFELIFIRFYIRNVLKNENNVYFGLGKDLLEEDLSHQVNIQGHNVTLGGSVDRIIVGDQVKIIDYKTGNSKFDSRKVELDEDFKHFYKLKYSIQLKLYKYIYFKKYGIHSESIVFSKAGGDYESKEFKYNVIEGFKYKSEVENRAIELLLEDIITKVYQEEITQTEDTKVCQYCNFKGVCLRYEKIKDY